MKKIQMVDLGGQYQKIKSEIGSSINEILESSAFINGPIVKEFQLNLENYLGVNHVIPCANGTDALQVAMMGLGLKPGDEVITADFTFASTVEVIALLGLTPVLIDVCPNLFTINVEEIEKAITARTKAIVPVHLFGHCANMEAIMNIAEKYKLFVIDKEKFENKYKLEDYGVTLHEQNDQLIVDKLNWKGEAKKSGIQIGDIISNFKIENPERPNKTIVYPFALVFLIIFGYFNYRQKKN